MGKATARISPGICGSETIVEADTVGDMQVRVCVTSDCERVQQLGEQLSEPIGIRALFGPYDQTFAVRTAAQFRLHSCCPVPCGLVKAIEVAAGLALPADVRIEVSLRCDS